MAAELWVNDSGVARQIREVWVNDSGVARRIQEIWVNDSGTARRIYISDVVSITNQGPFSSSTGSTATAQYQLDNVGQVRITQTDNSVSAVENWLTPATNVANYECRVTVNSGLLTTGTTGAWLGLGTARTWTLSRSSNGTSSCNFTVEIRRASDAVVLDSATISMSAQFTP